MSDKSEDQERLLELGEHLRRLREAHAKTTGRKYYQRTAAEAIGIKEDTYRSYEYGRVQLPEEYAKRLASEWGIHWQEFYKPPRKRMSQSLEATGSGPATLPPKIPAEVLDVPLPYVGYVAASSKVDWTDPLDTVEMEYVPAEMAARGRFTCRIQGDSCYPWLWPDDVCVWQETENPRLNAICYFRSIDSTVTVKQIKHNGENFILKPANPAYSEEVAVGKTVGYLVGVIRNIGGLKITIYKNGDTLLPSDLMLFNP